jgi:DNA polymerase-3 subunit delta
MVAVKSQDADRLVANPPPGAAAFLVFGPDSGLASERAARIAAGAVDASDPFSLIRLDGAAVTADPARLADEAYSVSMFGGRRAILIRDAGSRAGLADILALLLKSPPPETTVVVQAGDLKKSNPLRTLFERDRNAYAIICYEDTGPALIRLVDEEVKAHGLTITPSARALLVSSLGGDRLLSRAEVNKLCLYALKARQIVDEDVLATVVDSAGLAVDDIVDATATGELQALDVALSRAEKEGLDPGYIAGAVLRHFHMLDKARSGMDAGASARDAVEGIRPPIYFQRKAKVEKALRIWPAAMLPRACARLATTARDARLNAVLSRAILAEALIGLCRYASGR